MTRATDKELGGLHSLLAKQMREALESSNEARDLLDALAANGEELPPAVEAFLEKSASANPALLTAVSKFLKDNNITCAIEDSEDMTALQRQLKSKKKHSVGNVVALDTEKDFG